MKKGKYEKAMPVAGKKRGLNTRVVTLVLALGLLVGGVVGGTIAWLTDKTEDVENTFTVGDIDIELDETENLHLKMIPGWTIDKDPVVTVKADSEDCWVFIKVDESANLDDYIAYAIDSNNWTQGDGTDIPKNVYYLYANDITADRKIKVLGEGSFPDPMGTKDNPNDDITVTWGSQQVGVKPSVTKQKMDDLKVENATQPTLTFTAYAVQYWKSNETPFTAAEAWAKITPPASSN